MYQRTLTVHPQHLAGFVGIDSNAAYANLSAVGIHDSDQVVFFKIAFDVDDTYR